MMNAEEVRALARGKREEMQDKRLVELKELFIKNILKEANGGYLFCNIPNLYSKFKKEEFGPIAEEFRAKGYIVELSYRNYMVERVFIYWGDVDKLEQYRSVADLDWRIDS